LIRLADCLPDADDAAAADYFLRDAAAAEIACSFRQRQLLPLLIFRRDDTLPPMLFIITPLFADISPMPRCRLAAAADAD